MVKEISERQAFGVISLFVISFLFKTKRNSNRINLKGLMINFLMISLLDYSGTSQIREIFFALYSNNSFDKQNMHHGPKVNCALGKDSFITSVVTFFRVDCMGTSTALF